MISGLTAWDALPFIATILGLIGQTRNDDNELRFFASTGALLVSLYFIAQGMPGSATVAALISARTLISVWVKNYWVGAILIVLHIALPLSITTSEPLAVVAGVIGCIGFYFLSGWRLRMTLAGCCSMWVINNLWHGAWAGAAVEALGAFLNMWKTARLRAQILAGEPS